MRYSLAIVGGIIVTGIYLHNDIINYFGKHTIQVATVTLEQNELREKNQTEAKVVADIVLNDDQLRETCKALGKDIVNFLSNYPDIKQDISLLLVDVLKTDDVTNETINLLCRVYDNHVVIDKT